MRLDDERPSKTRKKLNNIIYLHNFTTPTCSSKRNKN